MEIITRDEAKERGLKYYFTGKPCAKGHVSERKTVDGYCITCDREARKKRMRIYNKTEAARNAVKRYLKSQKGKEALQRSKAAYNSTEKGKEQNKERLKRWAKTDYGKARSRLHSLEVHKKRSLRIPAWSEKEQIELFYANCPDGMEVDHIIPLCGKRVSGLHVLSKLQYLSIEENRSKRNKFEVE
ncbi:hypothetical protein OMDBNIEC_00018 [Salmonella phage STP-SP5]|nr:hypothetical protein OMDBNIEC_00018 [Salmonella phage STP-SP5]